MKRVSSFTVIVAFVCLALVGVALIPLLPVKLNPSRSLPGFTVGFSMPGTSSRVVEDCLWATNGFSCFYYGKKYEDTAFYFWFALYFV